MNREDIERSVVSPFGKKSRCKPDLYQVTVNGRTFMVKDVRHKNFIVRWTFGLWLIAKEWKVYSRLAGVRGIPQPIERIDRFAFAMEFTPGRKIRRNESVAPDFFSTLARIVEEIHSRGVVHLDLRHKGNILVSDRGEPIVIDFNGSLVFRKGSLAHRLLFPILRRVDRGGIVKLKQRVSPELLTEEERAFAKRFQWLRRLWFFD